VILRYCYGDGVMGVGLQPIASRPLTGRSIKIRMPLSALRPKAESASDDAQVVATNCSLLSGYGETR